MIYHKALFWVLFFSLYTLIILLTFRHLFADDTSLVLNDKKLENLQTKIRTKVTKISKWLIANKLTLNLSKSNIMTIDPIKLKHLKNSYNDFTRFANIDMKNVNLVKYLGITLIT